MFGVVLWSDAKDGKAVFWCEDQGDLAYFEHSSDPLQNTIPFDAGDMVQFEVSVEQRLRRASNARLVQEQAYPGLPETLRENASATPAPTKVIPLQTFRQPDTPISEPSKLKA